MSELNRNQEAIRYFEHLRRRFYDSANETYWGKVHNATTREMIDTALDALRRAQPANEPLTLEELQKGDVVWIKDLVMGEVTCLHFDRVEPATYHAGNDYRFEQFGTDTGIIRWACKYGINWLAYRHPPERSENE